jgi:hypothetical protein
VHSRPIYIGAVEVHRWTEGAIAAAPCTAPGVDHTSCVRAAKSTSASGKSG